MTKNISIDFANPYDVEEIRGLCLKWSKEMGHDISKQRIDSEINGVINNGRLFVAKLGDDIIGILGAIVVSPVWNGHKVAHEHYMFVRPDFRGLGLMKVFIEALERWAKIMGCSEVTFHPNVFGAPKVGSLVKAMERNGYAITGYEVTKGI